MKKVSLTKASYAKAPPSSSAATEIVHADATKEFFIEMLTRDIPLLDCVLDLTDNCIDGANRTLGPVAQDKEDIKYSGYELEISLTPSSFKIADNCGGMSINLAKNKAFYFGRPKQTIDTVTNGIGLYGIGMKRALFKMGTVCEVRSSTQSEAFVVPINVPVWRESPLWEFRLERTAMFKPAGTKIAVLVLRERCAAEFADSQFLNQLRRTMARDYSFILQKGMEMKVNDNKIEPYVFRLRLGANLEPVHYSYDDEGVNVTISAGLAALPEDKGDDDSSEIDYFGWFVACNDRVVVASDKTVKTVWGDDRFQVWHPQYNGFMGIVSFRCSDGAKLPWSTTKRDIDRSNKVFQRALAKMKTATQQYIAYSNARKSALEKAKAEEANSEAVPVAGLKEAKTMKLPSVSSTNTNITVSYPIARTQLKKVAKALGNPSMPASKVGLKTFHYYVENEL